MRLVTDNGHVGWFGAAVQLKQQQAGGVPSSARNVVVQVWEEDTNYYPVESRDKYLVQYSERRHRQQDTLHIPRLSVHVGSCQT